MNTACLSVWQSASAFLFIFLERWRLSSICKKNADVCCSGSDVYHTDIKMVGITYVAEFAMNICKDAGYAAVGNQIELFAKLSILVLSIPVLTVFLETVGSFL